MKRLIASILLTVFIFTGTECKQLLKLPMLFIHFTEHYQENVNLTFADYLKMHYTQESDGDGDYSDDMKLPFKSYNTFVNILLAPIHTSAYHLVPNVCSVKKLLIIQQQIYASAQLSSIWQPPQFC